MSLTSGELSPADIRACTCGNDNSNGNGWGGDGGAWWIIILFLFVFCGWGGNGFGGFGGGNGAAANGALTRGELCMDMNFQDVKNGVMNTWQGICDSTYALNNSIQTASAATQQGFANAELSRCNQQAALMQMLYTMSANQQNCCCETKQAIAETNYNIATQANGINNAIAGVNYNLATQSCDTRNTIQNSTRDIIDNQNANTRAILDKMSQQEIAAKDAQIAAQNQQIFGLQLAASQEKQNNYIVNALRPFPVASYTVPNPFASSCNYPNYNCGCNTGCCNG